jgi:ParB family chromosome partitioning protein
MEIETIEEISIDVIDDPVNAMRTDIDRDQLWELADNIKQNGLINPITVRPKNGRFEVVAGHRRLSACKIIGKIKIQCVVRELDDNKAFEVMASENLERQDVDPVDEAIFIGQFMQQTGKTAAEVAKSLRRSIGYVESRLAIGSMPDYMQAYLKQGKIKLGVALCLNQITVDTTRRVWCEMAARDGVSVAQAEYWLHGFQMSQLPGGILSDEPPTGYENTATQTVMFECAIDGKKYDSRMFKSVMIYEGNLQLFNDIVEQIRNTE